MNNELKEKAAKLLESCSEVAVSSVNENGYPRVCVMTKLKSVGFSEIYFSTGTSGTKTRHFKNNPKSSACYYKDIDSVTIVGEVEIIDDTKVKEELWQDWLIDHFPGGTADPEYCVLKFIGKEATIWIDGIFETFEC